MKKRVVGIGPRKVVGNTCRAGTSAGKVIRFPQQSSNFARRKVRAADLFTFSLTNCSALIFALRGPPLQAVR